MRMKRLPLGAAAGRCMIAMGNVTKISQVSSSRKSRISANHFNLPEAYTFLVVPFVLTNSWLETGSKHLYVTSSSSYKMQNFCVRSVIVVEQG